MSPKVTYGGTATSVLSNRAATDPIEGYCIAAVGLLPVVMNTAAGPWLGIVWYSERTIVSLSVTSATFGNVSAICTPFTFVAMDLNSPRIPSGASGLLSHISMVAGPPANHSRITLLAFVLPSTFRPFALASEARMPGSVRPRMPAEPMVRTSRRWKPSQSVRRVADMADHSRRRVGTFSFRRAVGAMARLVAPAALAGGVRRVRAGSPVQ